MHTHTHTKKSTQSESQGSEDQQSKKKTEKHPHTHLHPGATFPVCGRALHLPVHHANRDFGFSVAAEYAPPYMREENLACLCV